MLLISVTSVYLLLGLVGIIKAKKAKKFDTHLRAILIILCSMIGLAVISPFVLIELFL